LRRSPTSAAAARWTVETARWDAATCTATRGCSQTSGASALRRLPQGARTRVSAGSTLSDASVRAGRAMHDTCGRADRAGRQPPCMPRKEAGQCGERCAPIVDLGAVGDKRPEQIRQPLPHGPRAACDHGHGLQLVAPRRGHCQQQRHEVASPARARGSALPQQRAHRALPPKQCRVVRMGGAGCRHARETSPDVLRCAVLCCAVLCCDICSWTDTQMLMKSCQ